jgi:hypothetical protein
MVKILTPIPATTGIIQFSSEADDNTNIGVSGTE